MPTQFSCLYGSGRHFIHHADINVKSPDKFNAITRMLWFFPRTAMVFFSARKSSANMGYKKEEKTKQTKTNKICKT